MTLRRRPVGREGFAAAPTRGRVTRGDARAVCGGNQLTLAPLVAVLAPAFALLSPPGLRFGLACGCSLLGGKEELRGVSLWSCALSCSMRSSNDNTNAFTAGVISASSSGGILLM